MYMLALENMNLYHMTKVVQSHLIYEYSSFSAPPILLIGQVSTFYWHLERSRIISANCSLDSFHTITWRACAWQFSNHRKKAFIPVSTKKSNCPNLSTDFILSTSTLIGSSEQVNLLWKASFMISTHVYVLLFVFLVNSLQWIFSTQWFCTKYTSLTWYWTTNEPRISLVNFLENIQHF